MKYFAHFVVFNEEIYKNSICEITDDKVIIEPFNGETPNTIFINGILVISHKNLKDSEFEFINILNSNLEIQKAVELILDKIKGLEKDSMESNLFVLPITL